MATPDIQQIGWNATSKEGVVAAGSAEAVAAGITILAEGGNAADAAVSTILALTVTDHGACSIGGEVPLLIYDAGSQTVKALSGQGRAPLSQKAIDWYLENGIPEDIKMAPVPSVVDLCITTLQKYGTRSLEEVLPPTLALLDTGTKPWHPKLARTLRRMVQEEQITSGSREQKLQGACDRFYGRNKDRNDIAEELEEYYIQQGGFLRISDLAAHTTTIEDPLTITYKGYTICKCGPWTQGPFLLQALKLLEDFDLKGMKQYSADYIHLVTESIKLAMADRDLYYGDPEFVDVPLPALLSDTYTEIRRSLIDPGRGSQEARPGDPHGMKPLLDHPGVFRPGPGGTTTCVVADRWGNVVSATPSANVPKEPRDGGKAGVTYSNRLRSLNTTPGHPNCIQPGKRPRTTLTPTLVLKNGLPILAISVAGGDLQDQVTLNLLLDFIEFDLLPKNAVTAPRFATAHHEDSFDPNPDRVKTFKEAGSLTISENTSKSTQKELKQRGHKLTIATSPIGAPVMLYIDQETGDNYAAGDPESHRHAAGLDNN